MTNRVSFNPNPSGLTYHAQGREAEKIGRAKIGVVTHLKYEGSDITDMSAHSNVDHENFNSHHDVHQIDPRIDASQVDYGKKDHDKFYKHMDAAKKIHDTHGKEMYSAVERHSGAGGHLETYINHTVRTGETPDAAGFSKFINDKYIKMRDKYKTQIKRDQVDAERKSHIEHIATNSKHYNNLLAMHGHLQKAKNVLVHALNKNSEFKHTHAGEAANPEGYVIHHGTPSKLINRTEFSRRNLLGRRR